MVKFRKDQNQIKAQKPKRVFFLKTKATNFFGVSQNTTAKNSFSVVA